MRLSARYHGSGPYHAHTHRFRLFISAFRSSTWSAHQSSRAITNAVRAKTKNVFVAVVSRTYNSSIDRCRLPSLSFRSSAVVVPISLSWHNIITISCCRFPRAVAVIVVVAVAVCIVTIILSYHASTVRMKSALDVRHRFLSSRECSDARPDARLYATRCVIFSENLTWWWEMTYMVFGIFRLRLETKRYDVHKVYVPHSWLWLLSLRRFKPIVEHKYQHVSRVFTVKSFYKQDRRWAFQLCYSVYEYLYYSVFPYVWVQ